MPFIGNQPALSYTSFAKQDFSTSATTSYTLDNPVANANELALFINFVRQEPTTAYSASGTTLTLTSATSSSDDMYCVYLGKAVQTVNPPNASVGASQIVDASITSGKLASGVLPTNTPTFEAYLSANQTISNTTVTKMQFNTERFDTNSAYDNSTNYRFTVPSGEAGKYFIYARTTQQTQSGSFFKLYQSKIYIYKNGSNYKNQGNYNNNSSQPINQTLGISATMDLSVGDYIEIFGWTESGDGSGGQFNGNSYFGAYKLIG